uniref:Uncharacterized protein n=1 Tax=Arundo donax TaxID=35708 RepID=A0A0A9CIL5_ARUDO
MIFQSFKSLFTDSFHTKFGLSRPLLTLSARFNLSLCIVASGACIVYAQTISNDVGQASLQLVLPQHYHVCHHSGPDPFLCGHIYPT